MACSAFRIRYFVEILFTFGFKRYFPAVLLVCGDENNVVFLFFFSLRRGLYILDYRCHEIKQKSFKNPLRVGRGGIACSDYSVTSCYSTKWRIIQHIVLPSVLKLIFLQFSWCAETKITSSSRRGLSPIGSGGSAGRMASKSPWKTAGFMVLLTVLSIASVSNRVSLKNKSI